MSLLERAARLVSPEPPHDPEPYPCEPFAPVYDFIPLPDSFSGMRLFPPVTDPHGPDPLVFGPQYPRGRGDGCLTERCGACGVTWAAGSGTACWACGPEAGR